MPSYTTSSTATALGINQKWLDNLLSHNKLDGVHQIGQGVSRRLTLESITVIAVAHALVESMHVPAGRSVKLAEQLIMSQTGTVALSPTLAVTVDLAGLRRSLLQQLAHAVEVTPRPTRGRPPIG